MRIVRKVELYNAWTVQGSTQEPLAGFGRPANWGDPFWHLEKFRLEWQVDGEDTDTFYGNNVFIWTDIKMDRSEYPEFFATLITKILHPGMCWQLCGEEFLAEGDNWLLEWGEKPAIFMTPPAIQKTEQL